MSLVTIAHLVRPGVQLPGHKSARFRKRVRKLRPITPSTANERAYLEDLRVLTGALKIIAREHVMPVIRETFPGKLAVDADVPPRIQEIVGDIAKKFGKVDEQAQRMAKLAARRSLVSVDKKLAREAFDSVGVNIEPYLAADGHIAHALGEKVLDNVALIKTIPEQFFFGLRDAEDSTKIIRRGLVDVISDNWREGARWETMVGEIEALGGVTERRAAVIARDQTAKMNAAFGRERCLGVGIEEYEWAATKDERTRPDHWDLHGERFSFNEPGPLAGTIDGEPCHPGEDVECRCDAIPYIDLDALEQSMGLAPMRAEEADRWIS